ncbi:MAG TPA: helix-turn-helix domain-containing protein [Sulfurimonas autotrophica]|nr:helix-turn-helix domain-containing protein [Sulfurimonas autotrophica]
MHKNKGKVQLGYTTIMHDPRLQFELSNNEYCIADAIYHLSHNPDGAVIGWCYASRQTIGDFFGLSRQTIISALKRLEDKKLIEKNVETGYLKTTKIWYLNFVMYKLEKRKIRL